jgi:hypothetical protein
MTDVFDEPVTVAVNCSTALARSVTVPGETLTRTLACGGDGGGVPTVPIDDPPVTPAQFA